MFKKWMEYRATRAKAKAEAESRRIAEHHRQREGIRSFRRNIVRIVESGAVPKVDWPGHLGLDRLPFRFLEFEHPLLIVPGVEYFEYQTRQRTVGDTISTDVSVAKGVSLQTGSHHTTSVEYEKLEKRGVGSLAITNKHIYFAGRHKSVRIPHGMIVSIEREGDAMLKVTRDHVSGLPEFFSVGSLRLDCVLEILDRAPAIDFGRGETEVRALPDTEVQSWIATVVLPTRNRKHRIKRDQVSYC